MLHPGGTGPLRTSVYAENTLERVVNSHGYGPSGMKQTHCVTWVLRLSEAHLGNGDGGGELGHDGEGRIGACQVTLSLPVSKVNLVLLPGHWEESRRLWQNRESPGMG